MTPKENLLALLHGEKQDAFVNEWEPYGNVFDPLMGATLTAKLGESVHCTQQLQPCSVPWHQE